jgi:hypothetical protein
MKPTNPMAQLQQWKANHQQGKINQFVNETNQSKIGSVKGNKLNIEPVKSAIKNCERNFETAKRSKTQRTLDNTGFIKRNCETGCEFAKAQNSSVNRPKIGEIKNTQGNEHSTPKAKYQGKLSFNSLAFEYAQLTRQFKLILDSNRKCLEVYPDDFHHKLKMRDEMMDLIDRLKAGGKLFNALAKSQGITFCRDNQSTLKDFNQANGYLIHKFEEVITQINHLNIERVKSERLQGVSNE